MSEPLTEDRQDEDAGWVETDLEGDLDDDLDAVEERLPGYPPDGLVSLRYLWDAVRRHAPVWIVTAVVGLVAGLAFPFVLPPPAVATTKLLLTHRSGDDPAQAIATDVRLATTDTVAARVISDLGLHEEPTDLLKRYTVEPTTDRIVEISVTAPTEREAVREATAIASTFLEFRMEQVLKQLQPTVKELENLQNRAAELEHKIVKNGGSVDDVPKSRTQIQLERTSGQIEQVAQTVQEQEASAALMSSSRTLDPAAVVDRSAIKTIGIDAATGLGGGFVLGVGFVVARALLSDRLWRRQAIADAFGAPVAVSLGRLPVRPWQRWQRWPWRAACARNLRTAVDALRDTVSWTTTTTPTLAVVAVDDVQESALLVAEVAHSFLREGRRVLVADLTPSGALAKQLGLGAAGEVVSDDLLSVYVLDLASGPATGGLRRRRAELRNPVLAAWDDADLVLTFTELDPSRGGEHLTSWASRAVAVVRAGRSTATRIHATGEMVRLAGLRLDSVVLLGQDVTDQTIGQPAGAGVPTVGVVDR